MTMTESIRYIPAKTLKRLNKLAVRNGKYCLTDNCPVLVEGKNVPIFLSIPSFDDGDWVRCQIPATSDCLNHVFLDIRCEDFEKLPIIQAEDAAKSEEVDGSLEKIGECQ
jgi:hypothetical protein